MSAGDNLIEQIFECAEEHQKMKRDVAENLSCDIAEYLKIPTSTLLNWKLAVFLANQELK